MYQNNDQSASVDGLAAALPCKTPVSLLQELCMRRGISPKYDLLQIEGAVHEPTFVYRVTVGEFTANGSGQSKKKAKHAAAKAVLDIIIHGGGPVSTGSPVAAVASQHSGPSLGDTSTGPVANNDNQHADLSTMVVSPYDDGIPGNPVGQLQELCMTRRWPPPTYQLTAEEGFPHERTFSIACTIATYKEVGGGKSKKLAKRQAACSMLQKLRELPQEQQPSAGLNEDDDDVLARSGDGSDPSRSPADDGHGDRLLEEEADGRADTLLHGDSGDATTKGRRTVKNKQKNKSLFDDDELQSFGARIIHDDGLPLFADQTSFSPEIAPERDGLFQDYRTQVTSSDDLFQDYRTQVTSSDSDSLFHDYRAQVTSSDGLFQDYKTQVTSSDGMFQDYRAQVTSVDGLFQDYKNQVSSSDGMFPDYRTEVTSGDGLIQDIESKVSGGSGRESKRCEGSLFPEYDCLDGGIQIDDGRDSYCGSRKLRSKTRREQSRNLDRYGGDGNEGIGLPSNQYESYD